MVFTFFLSFSIAHPLSYWDIEVLACFSPPLFSLVLLNLIMVLGKEAIRRSLSPSIPSALHRAFHSLILPKMCTFDVKNRGIIVKRGL